MVADIGFEPRLYIPNVACYHYTISAILFWQEQMEIEPSSAVLETAILPLNYAPLLMVVFRASEDFHALSLPTPQSFDCHVEVPTTKHFFSPQEAFRTVVASFRKDTDYGISLPNVAHC